jgi:hypothetical protein
MTGRLAGNWGFGDSNHMTQRQPNYAQHPGWLRLQQLFGGNGGGWG